MTRTAFAPQRADGGIADVTMRRKAEMQMRNFTVEFVIKLEYMSQCATILPSGQRRPACCAYGFALLIFTILVIRGHSGETDLYSYVVPSIWETSLQSQPFPEPLPEPFLGTSRERVI